MRTATKHIARPFNSLTYIFIAELVFSIHDVIIKSISGNYPVHEIVFFRSIVALVPLFLIAQIKGWDLLKTSRPVAQAVRALVMFGSYLCFYLSLSALPIAETVSLFFSSPIFITILSVVLLKEKVSPGGWIAVFTGFLGVLVMLKPGAGMIDPAAILAVFSAMLYAVSSIMTRNLGRTESGFSLVFYVMLVYSIASAVLAFSLGRISVDSSSHPSLVFFLRAWHLPGITDLLPLLCIGILGCVGIFCLTQAYRLEQPSKIAPFEYGAVPLGALWGYLFFKDILDLQSIVGIILIVGAGLYIFRSQKS